MDYLPWGRLAVNQLSEGVLYLNRKPQMGHKHTEPYTHINKRVLVNELALKKKKEGIPTVTCSLSSMHRFFRNKESLIEANLIGYVDRTVIDIDAPSCSESRDH